MGYSATTPTQRLRATAYISQIRNRAKLAYAVDYFEYCIGKALTEPSRGELSVMGAQAVRLALADIFRAQS